MSLAVVLAALSFYLRLTPISFIDDGAPIRTQVLVRGELAGCQHCPASGVWYAHVAYAATMRDNETQWVTMWFGTRDSVAPHDIEARIASPAFDIVPEVFVTKKGGPFPSVAHWLLKPKQEGNHLFTLNSSTMWNGNSQVRYIRVDGQSQLPESTFRHAGGIVQFPITVLTARNVTRRTADVTSWAIGLLSFAFGLLGIADYLKEKRRHRDRRPLRAP